METTSTNRYITIINNISNDTVHRIIFNDNFYDNLNSFLEKYKGPNEDYVKLICNDILINSINIFRIDNTFVMFDNTNIIYMVKSYKKYAYVIKHGNGYKLNALYVSHNTDQYYNLLRYVDTTYEDVINYSHRELIMFLLLKRQYVYYYYYSSLFTNDMLNDYNFMLEVCQCNPAILSHVSDKLAINKEFILNLILYSDHVLEYITYSMQNNYDIVLAAVTKHGLSLNFASSELRNNYDIVLAAVTQNGLSLNFASIKLQNNYDIVLAAVKSNNCALEYASKRLQNNRKIVLSAYSTINNPCYFSSYVLQYASKNLMNNYKFVLQLINLQNQGNILLFISDRLKDNYNIVLAAILQDYRQIRYASDRLKDNYDIVLAAISQDYEQIQYASDRLKDILKI